MSAGVREMNAARKKRTELLDVARLVFGVRLELLLQSLAIASQELFDRTFAVMVFPSSLQRIQRLEIALASCLQVGYRQFGQLVLCGKRYSGLWWRLVVAGSGGIMLVLGVGTGSLLGILFGAFGHDD